MVRLEILRTSSAIQAFVIKIVYKSTNHDCAKDYIKNVDDLGMSQIYRELG